MDEYIIYKLIFSKERGKEEKGKDEHFSKISILYVNLKLSRLLS